MTRLLFVSTLVICLLGCASGVQMLRKIDPGMAPAQVDEIMGRRDGFSTAERDGHTYTLYQYINRFCNAHVNMHEKCDFYVIFKDARVIETGAKDVRSNSPNMQFLYVFQQP